jgi:hypothetical protein
LKTFFFPTSPVQPSDYAVAFDNACASREGCHVSGGTRRARDMRHGKGQFMQFGQKNTAGNPKIYTWYTQTVYKDEFFLSQSPWVVKDEKNTITGTTQFGICVSCHDPHGSGPPGVTDAVDPPGDPRNVMSRGNWKSQPATYCNGACHRRP